MRQAAAEPAGTAPSSLGRAFPSAGALTHSRLGRLPEAVSAQDTEVSELKKPEEGTLTGGVVIVIPRLDKQCVGSLQKRNKS